jgi:hypothetical protein
MNNSVAEDKGMHSIECTGEFTPIQEKTLAGRKAVTRRFATKKGGSN